MSRVPNRSSRSRYSSRSTACRIAARFAAAPMNPFRLRQSFRDRLMRGGSSRSMRDGHGRNSHSVLRMTLAMWHNIFMAAGFLKVFPTLDNVLIESWEEDNGVGKPYMSTLPPRTYGAPHPVRGRKIRCANPKCRRGGFDISQDISEMVYEKLTTREFVKDCLGDEGSPKGHKLGRDCTNTLHYRLTLKYKP
jgi:hypothetical protein